MLRFIRAVRPRVGKQQEALQLAKEIAAYLNMQNPGNDPVQLSVEVLGDVGTIRFSSLVPDLATLAIRAEKNQADQGLQAILRKGEGVFADGTLHDTVVQLL